MATTDPSARSGQALTTMSDAELNLAVYREVMGHVTTPGCPGVLKTRVRNDPFVWCDDCGLKVPWDCPEGTMRRGKHGVVPAYAGEIAAAWRVVEALRTSRGFYLTLDQDTFDDRWRAIFDGSEGENADVEVEYDATANTAPRAICLAALKAVRAGQDR